MFKHLRESIRITVSNAGLILLLAITCIQVNHDSTMAIFLTLAGGILSFILSTIICGRISGTLHNENPLSSLEILKRHWLNMLIVNLVVYSVPIIIMLSFSDYLGIHEFYIRIYMRSAIAILAVYIVPYIFLKNEGMGAIKKGLRFLFGNIKASTPVIVLALAPICITFIAFRYLFIYMLPQLYKVITFGVLYNFTQQFIAMVVFAFAYKILLEHGETKTLIDASIRTDISAYRFCPGCGLNMPKGYFLDGSDVCIECAKRNDTA